MNKSRERIKGDDDPIFLSRFETIYQFAAKYAVGKTVLDLGCSDGYGSFMLAGKAKQVKAIDKDEQSIAEAKEAYKRKNLNFLIADANNLPWKNKFDFVISSHVIEHMENVELYLEEINKVLKETGLVIFCTPNRKLRLDKGQKPWNKFHVTEFDQTGLKQLLRGHFKNIKIYGLHYPRQLLKIEKRRLYFRRKIAKFDIFNIYHHIPLLFTNLFLKKIIKTILRRNNAENIERKLWVSNKNIANSLDLIAVCKKR